MCKTRKPIQPNFEAPIFSNLVLGDFMVVTCGGGGKRFGLKNRIMSYRGNKRALEDKVFEMDTGEDIVENLRGQGALIGGTADEFVVIYQMDREGRLTQQDRFRADWSKEGCVNSVVFVQEG